MAKNAERYKFLFVVETKSKDEDSDYVYIRKLLNDYYDLSKKGHKLQPIYCNGKGNITKKEKQIAREIKNYTGTKTFVFVCIDVDTENKRDSREKNDEIYKYCNKNNYKFIWFCYDSENVFLGKTIDDDKTKEAIKFSNKGTITKELISRMKSKTENYNSSPNKTSNIITVFENLGIKM